ncbi:MAG: hypothetical protein U0P30_00100 [Vicinamibacterales bacterium]
MTFAFGMPAIFKEAYRTGVAPLRAARQADPERHEEGSSRPLSRR